MESAQPLAFGPDGVGSAPARPSEATPVSGGSPGAPSDAGFRLLAECAPLGILILADDGRPLFVNQSAADLLRASAEEILASPIATFVDPSGYPVLAQRLADRIAGLPVPNPYEALFRRRDGTALPVEITGIRMTWQGQLCDLVFFSDVTDRRNAYEALREEKETLRSIFENCSEAILLTAPDGTIAAANPAACRMVGRSAEQIRALGRSAFIDSSDPRLPAALEERARTGRFRGELCGIRASGERFPADVTSDFFTDAQGRQRTATIIRDATERRRAEDAVRRSEALVHALNAELEARVTERTEALASANEELRSFTYTVAHDLTAPLRGINGLAGRILEDCGAAMNEQTRALLGRILEESARGGRLIEALLDHARVSVARPERQEVDLGALASQILKRLEGNEPDRRVDGMVAAGLVARADRRLVTGILEQLLSNAWKFTARRERARIEVGVEDQDGETVYFVKDDGAGFDPSHAGRLFGMFQRAHAETEFAGLGVGLALAERAVRRHGGWIRIDGSPGRGVTVRFTLRAKVPVRNERPPNGAGSRPA